MAKKRLKLFIVHLKAHPIIIKEQYARNRKHCKELIKEQTSLRILKIYPQDSAIRFDVNHVN